MHSESNAPQRYRRSQRQSFQGQRRQPMSRTGPTRGTSLEKRARATRRTQRENPTPMLRGTELGESSATPGAIAMQCNSPAIVRYVLPTPSILAPACLSATSNYTSTVQCSCAVFLRLLLSPRAPLPPALRTELAFKTAAPMTAAATGNRAFVPRSPSRPKRKRPV